MNKKAAIPFIGNNETNELLKELINEVKDIKKVLISCATLSDSAAKEISIQIAPLQRLSS